MIRFAISLSDQGQAEEARRQIVAFLAARDVQPTGGGRATLSFVATPEAFDALFGSSLRNLPDPLPRPRGAVGASGPAEEPHITIPEELEPFVDHISLPPTARRFGGGV